MTSRPFKQYGELTPEDFQTHPVWVSCHLADEEEVWFEETDEESFRPWLGPLPVDPSGLYLVAAAFSLADGTQLEGFVTPASPDEPYPGVLGTVQPCVFSAEGQVVCFWLGMFPQRASVQRAYNVLAKHPSQVFPVQFNASRELMSGVREGEIAGFYSVPGGLNSKVVVEQ